MLLALLEGRALPAGELARAATVSAQSASAHLQKLVDARVLSVWAQGRFRYYRISDDDVAELILNLANLAARTNLVGRRRPAVLTAANRRIIEMVPTIAQM